MAPSVHLTSLAALEHLQNPWLSLDEQMAARRSGGYDAPGRAKPPWLALGSGGAWAWGAAALEGLTTEPGQEPPQAPPPLSPFSRLVRTVVGWVSRHQTACLNMALPA